MNVRGLIIAVVLLAGAGGTLYFLEKRKGGETKTGASKPEEKLFGVAADQIRQITIEPAAGDRVKLERAGEKWKITEPRELVADDAAISSMAGALGGLTVSDTIEEKPASLKDYGLDPPQVRVHFMAHPPGKPGAQRTLLLGENTPTGASVYARTEDRPRVVTIPSYIKSDLTKSLFDLRDKSAVKLDSATASRAWVENKSGKYELAKADDRWHIVAPLKARADAAAVNDLLRQAADAKMQAVESEDTAQSAKLGLAAPEITLRVQDPSGTHELRVSADKSGKRYARSSDQKAIFTVSSELATQLGKSAADLRNKDIFDMDTWTTTQVEATTPEGRVTLAKDGGNWKGSDPKKVPDSSAVTDMLEKLKALRATAFPAAGRYGLDKPILRAHVAWGEKKLKETVVAGQSGNKAYAQREGEPAVYEVAPDALAAAREAVNKLK